MNHWQDNLLGIGIYSVPEAARLTHISPWRIRRWLSGYSFISTGSRHSSSPVWSGDIPRIDGTTALSFRDLLEIRIIDSFLKAGVSWKTIRRAEQLGSEFLNTSHPFSTNRIHTDGRAIFAEVNKYKHEKALIDLIRSQRVFQTFINPFLKSLTFSNDGNPLQWWPYQDSQHIVIDPHRSFGQPITYKEGVPTQILASAFKTFDSIDKVANWYDVEPIGVEESVEYEKILVAA